MAVETLQIIEIPPSNDFAVATGKFTVTVSNQNKDRSIYVRIGPRGFKVSDRPPARYGIPQQQGTRTK